MNDLTRTILERVANRLGYYQARDDEGEWQGTAVVVYLEDVPALLKIIHDQQSLLRRAQFVAEHLYAMIPQSVWREEGAEYYGQYEGDKWAEDVYQEIENWKEFLR